VKLEREAKLRFPDPASARRAVEGLGARLRRARHFEDNLLLDDASGVLARSGSALRLRRADGRAILTYKGPRREDAAGLKVRPEIEVEVADGDGAQGLLEALGYVPAFRYQKFREVWDWKDAELDVDETPLGAFLEIEGPTDTIHEALRLLGRGPEDCVTESYPALHRAAGGQGDMVFSSRA
jgi:adenylate cyclase, class 2